MEGASQRVGTGEEAEVGAQSHPLTRLLASGVIGGTVAERKAQGNEVNHLLRALKPNDAQAARAILTALEEDWFETLTDSAGVACETVAIEALIKQGYPWALQIDPLDLERYRAWQAGPTRARWRIVMLGVLLAALVGGGLRLFSHDDPPPTPVQQAPKRPLAPQAREAWLGSTRVTADAMPYVDTVGTPIVSVTIRGTDIAKVEGEHRRVLPELQILGLRVFNEAGQAVKDFPGPARPIELEDVAGARSVVVNLPLPVELFPSSTRYFVVADLKVNHGPLASLRSSLVTARPSQSVPVALQATEPVLRPRPLKENHGKVKMLVSVDDEGKVEQALRLTGNSRDFDIVSEAVRRAGFEPSKHNGKAVASTFVFEDGPVELHF